MTRTLFAHRRLAALALVGAGVTACATPVSPLIEALEGVYVVPGRATVTQPDGSARAVPQATDCLVIARRSALAAEVYLSSIQAGGASCVLEGVAVVDGERLFLRDPDARDPRQGVYLEASSDAIRMRAQPQPGTNACGIHADLSALRFDRSSRQALDRSAPSLPVLCPAWNR